MSVFCKIKLFLKGSWIFNIINPTNQTFYVKLKVFVLFQSNEASISLYPNYYSERIFERRRSPKKKKFIPSNKPGFISIDSRWSKEIVSYPDTQIIFASVSKDLQPILNATVNARILRPSGDYISLQLYDDGLNSDRIANDGIYTRQFSGFNLNGVYFARVKLIINLKYFCILKIFSIYNCNKNTKVYCDFVAFFLF
jgi:hypothetical protein